MSLKVGQALVSSVDDTSVIVIRMSKEDVDLTCGGAPMYPKGTQSELVEADPGLRDGTSIGKRYINDAGLEVLCTKPGIGTLAADGVPLVIAQAKALPSSD